MAMLRLRAEGENAVRALIRACRNTGGYLGRIGDAAFEALQHSAMNPAFGPCSPQLVLWAQDAPDLPPRPWRIGPEFTFRCAALGSTVCAGDCVRRQQVSDLQRTRDTWRGEGSEYPACVTERCAQGRGIRLAVDADVHFRRVGPGKRQRALRSDLRAQSVARKRMQTAGLLEEERILDVTPDPVDE